MVLIFLILIFICPFISSLAFPYLELIYSAGLLCFFGIYLIYKKLSFSKLQLMLYPIILFILALIVSLVLSQDRANSLMESGKYISAILLFLVAASLSEKDKLLTVQTIILSGLVISLLAIYQYFFGFGHVLNYLSNNGFSFPFALDYLQSKRVFIPFVTPGILGGYLAMIIPLALINKDKVWLVLPVFFALFLTMSLGAFLSLFCALLIFFCARGKLKKKHFFSLIGLFILIVIIFTWRSMAQREHVHPVFSTLMRLSYWKETLEIIKAHPLAGVGLGNFNLKMSRYAHNSYLQIWAEMGLLGLFSFVWLVYVVIKSRFINLKQSLYNNQAACLLAATAVFLIHNFLDFTFFLPEVAFIWWVILGLIVV